MLKAMRSGITLIEVLLSLTVIGLLVGLAAPVMQSLQARNDLDVAANITAQTLRRAQALAVAVDGDMMWGVVLQPGSVVLFRGSSYAAREPTFDEQYDLAPAITPSGLTEVVFAKLTGRPQAVGTITLANPETSRTLTVNELGMIEY
ncbi:MAG: prepilin-type N-terminal cleavage/methylation domain-containing protein [Candidatus Kerfeldbacteria bacterium]|nr:prepilin-type N-terminal cleavage/methylation domain-containing protein [Candidatus Kerfeldbacteria bacterium]